MYLLNMPVQMESLQIGQVVSQISGSNIKHIEN